MLIYNLQKPSNSIGIFEILLFIIQLCSICLLFTYRSIHSCNFKVLDMMLTKNMTLDSVYGQRLNWFQYKNLQNCNFTFYSDFSKCPLCNFDPNEKPIRDDSHDLLITITFRQYTNIYPFIQSFRSTGSKAQILIVVDDAILQFITKHTPSFFKDCGVNLVSIGNYAKTYKRMLFYPKHFSVAFFLSTHHGFDRVMCTDMSDVVFQLNPFQMNLPKRFFVVPTEGINGLNASNLQNPKEINVIANFLSLNKNIDLQKTIDEYRFNGKRYVNAGLYMTTEELAREFATQAVELINSIDEDHVNTFDKLNHKFEEQDMFNYLVNEVVFKDSSDLFYDFKVNFEIFSVFYHFENESFSYTFPNYLYRNHKIRVFHETYMVAQYCSSIRSICPPLFDFSRYQRWKARYYRC